MGHAEILEQRLNQIRRKKGWSLWFVQLLAVVGVVFLLFHGVFRIAVVQGDSMSPALQDRDILVFLHLGAQYTTGDVVLVQGVDDTEQVKRIVGEPGERVEIDNSTGTILVDGEELEEPYIYEKTYEKAGTSFPLLLGEDEYFVLWDHRTNSRDSRNYGPVHAQQLEGKLVFLLRF